MRAIRLWPPLTFLTWGGGSSSEYRDFLQYVKKILELNGLAISSKITNAALARQSTLIAPDHET